MGKKPKKKVVEVVEKTSDDIYLERLTAYVEARMQKEIWGPEDKKRKEKKIKLTKRERKKIAQRRQDNLKEAVVKEREVLIQMELQRKAELKTKALAKAKKDGLQQEIRMKQLEDSCIIIDELKRQYLLREKEDMEIAEWNEYLKCDGLPDASDCGQLNMYLHLWDLVKDESQLPDSVVRTEEVLQLLKTLQYFIDCPAANERQRDDWKRVAMTFKICQKRNLDQAAYMLLKNIETNMVKNGIKTAYFNHIDKNFIVCLWALIQLPVPMHNPKKPKRPREDLNFPDIKLHVLFPEAIHVWALCVRAMYLSYDHYSPLSRTYQDPVTPELLKMNFCDSSRYEWERRVEISNEIARDAESTDINQNPPLPTDLPKTEAGISSTYIGREGDWFEDVREEFMYDVDENEINLRKYMVLGGIYYLELLYQPPQPVTMVLQDITVATLQIPKWLKDVPFLEEYIPPPPPPAAPTSSSASRSSRSVAIKRTPEEIEAELKKQEEDFDRLIFITLSLSDDVMWLDVPIVGQWDEKEQIWTTENVWDVKHIEEKQMLTFRTGKFGIFAIAMNKYCNMPYQAWEVKPTLDGKIILTIMAAVLIIEFTVEENQICVSQIQNTPNNALSNVIGKFYKLQELKRILQEGGVNVFPDDDAFCYVNGVCEKLWSMERHLYYNMAQVCLYYNFAWSRWNLMTGRRDIVLQMRDFIPSEKIKSPNYSMLLVNPLKTHLVECTEVSTKFSDEPVPKTKFYADLIHLIYDVESATVIEKIRNTPTALVYTVANLLNATRLVSFS